MSMTRETLEIIIGKFLDGEITPGERRLLEAELERSPEAKELFDQLQELHKRCREAVSSELLGRGQTSQEVFEQAWDRQPVRLRSEHPSFRSIGKMRDHVRFAAGLAAGLAIGLALHFVLPIISVQKNQPAGPGVLARDVESGAGTQQPELPGFAVEPAADVIRNVDWYNFTDGQGNKWLVEGLRENVIKPAAYYEGL